MFRHLQFEHVVLQLPLKLQEALDGELSPQVGPEEVRGEGGATAAGLQRVARGGAVAMPHAHAGLRADYTLDLQEAPERVHVTEVFSAPAFRTSALLNCRSYREARSTADLLYVSCSVHSDASSPGNLDQ